jgi:hypothetical protein
MVCILRSAVRSTIIGVLCIVLVGISGYSIAVEYNEDISKGIPALAYWYGMMNLDSGEYVHLDLHVTGSANFFFVDSSNLARFRSLQSFSYLASLSREHTNAIDLTAQVPYSGTWYVVVANTDGFNSLSLTGHISAYTNPITGPIDIQCVTLILAAAAVIVLVIAIAIALSPRKPKVVVMQQSQSPQWVITPTPGQRAFCDYCGAPRTPGAMACHRCGRRFLRKV